MSAALAMPSALACGEFVLHYQPLVDLRSGNVAGLEALARWEHPRHGLLGPDTFIGIAEESGFIIPLGASLLYQACRDAVSWVTPYVSVNLAPAQLIHPSLHETVLRTLESTGLAPQRLQLEITEHPAMESDREILSTLRALADLGVRIALDGFGSGYSNLAALPALPLCELQLGHSFLTGSRAFLSTVVSLGRSLNLTVAAEGIETKAQARLMRDLGCDTGQGWYFSKPVAKWSDHLTTCPV